MINWGYTTPLTIFPQACHFLLFFPPIISILTKVKKEMNTKNATNVIMSNIQTCIHLNYKIHHFLIASEESWMSTNACPLRPFQDLCPYLPILKLFVLPCLSLLLSVTWHCCSNEVWSEGCFSHALVHLQDTQSYVLSYLVKFQVSVV